MSIFCPDCGGAIPEDGACLDHFNLMIVWEWEHQLYDVHHLMVLSYYLQHPHLYSREGLEGALELLRRFIIKGEYVFDVREELRPSVQQNKRNYPVTARPDNIGAYAYPVTWTMSAADVVAAGVSAYTERIYAWADSLVGSLRAAGILDY